jgi:hypothetical protein
LRQHLGEDSDRVGPQGPGHQQKLDEIDPSLTSFKLGHHRLRFAEPTGKPTSAARQRGFQGISGPDAIATSTQTARQPDFKFSTP